MTMSRKTKKVLCWLGILPIPLFLLYNVVTFLFTYIFIKQNGIFFACILGLATLVYLCFYCGSKLRDIKEEEWEERIKNSQVVFDVNDPNDEGWNTGVK